MYGLCLRGMEGRILYNLDCIRGKKFNAFPNHGKLQHKMKPTKTWKYSKGECHSKMIKQKQRNYNWNEKHLEEITNWTCNNRYGRERGSLKCWLVQWLSELCSVVMGPLRYEYQEPPWVSSMSTVVDLSSFSVPATSVVQKTCEYAVPLILMKML